MSVTRRLVLASSLMLFLELALIRWLGANILHLSYFANFVLLGSFLGIGLGFLLSRTPRTFLPSSLVILTGLVCVVLVAPVEVDQTSSEIIYFTNVQASGPPAWFMLPLIFCAVAAILVGPAEEVGRCFRELLPLDAYRLDLIGSLAGIAAFTVLSYLRAPSVAWGVLAAIGYIALLTPKRPVGSSVAALTLVGVLALESAAPGVSWSPYYKIETRSVGETSEQVAIHANGVPHQVMAPATALLDTEPQYGLPYDRLPENRLRRVLIVGAGSGSDVAIALSKGAGHVDAVEIDPRILQIGEERHPERPYSSERVTTYVNDGRAFLEQATTEYDLILFALPDSLALVTGASAVRLESYLFTREAVASARARLTPGGGFAMYNYYREDRLIDRLTDTVAHAFGHAPCVDRLGTGQGLAVIATALEQQEQQCASAQIPAKPTDRATLPTDDRPFPYFFGSMLPRVYVIALLGVLLVSLLSVRALSGPFRNIRQYSDLFFMGAAFLLLETKSVTSFALLFGTTWVVNAIVFSGVLGAVLLAVETTRRFPTPRLHVIYAGIAASLLVAYLVPNTALLQLPLVPRLAAAVALAFAPIFCANIAFAKRFAESSDSSAAFAVNILGAMVGGCLEYLSLLTGYRNLLLLAGLLYVAALTFSPRRITVKV